MINFDFACDRLVDRVRFLRVINNDDHTAILKCLKVSSQLGHRVRLLFKTSSIECSAHGIIVAGLESRAYSSHSFAESRAYRSNSLAKSRAYRSNSLADSRA